MRIVWRYLVDSSIRGVAGIPDGSSRRAPDYILKVVLLVVMMMGTFIEGFMRRKSYVTTVATVAVINWMLFIMFYETSIWEMMNLDDLLP